MNAARSTHRRPVRFSLITLSILALFALGTPLTAQQPQRPALDEEIDTLFSRWDETDSPGCALGIVQEGELVYTSGYGSANLDYEVPLNAQSVFYMASVSKQFTAVAVALAAQQGHVSLDDDIRDYFPELPDYGAAITVRHLVHHTSGLRDYLQLMTMAGMNRANVYTDDELLELITRQKALNFEPGERYLYSNSGYLLMAELIERTTGRTFREYTTEEVFEPLGMHNTHFHTDTRHIQKGRAIGYVPSRSQGFRIGFLANFDKVGSGGLYSTVEDMARWDHALDENTLGGRALDEVIHTPGVLDDGETIDYAFGLRLGEHRGLETVWHGGTMMGYKTAMLRFPDQKSTVICLCNLSNIDAVGLAHDVADILLADALGPRETEDDDESQAKHDVAAPELDHDELRAYTGSFFSEDLQTRYTIDLDRGTLRLHLANGSTRRVVPTDEDRFEAGSYELHFTRGPNQDITGFELTASRVFGVEFVRATP